MTRHKAVVRSGTVVAAEVVQLDYLYQFCCILRVGSISAGLQSTCPRAVVGTFVIKQSGVSRLSGQKTAMVLVALSCVVVGTEAFASCVVIMIHASSGPSVTLYAEMVVACTCQVTTSGSTLKQSLCERDAGRYIIT